MIGQFQRCSSININDDSSGTTPTRKYPIVPPPKHLIPRRRTPGLTEIINFCSYKLSKFSEQWPLSSINSSTERNTLWEIKTEKTKKQNMMHVALRHVGNDTTLFSHNGNNIFAPQHHHTLHLHVQYGTNPEVNVAKSLPLSGGCWKSFWELWEISSRAEIDEAGWSIEAHLPQFVTS